MTPHPTYTALVTELERRRQWPSANAVVGGVLFPRDADDLLAFMTEVHRQVEQLDSDLQDPARRPPDAPTIFYRAWSQFTRGRDDVVTTPVPPEPGRLHWFQFYADHSGSLDRTFHTDALWEHTLAYEQRLAQFHDAAVGYGAQPTMPRPKPGWDDEGKSALPSGLEQLGESIASGLGVVAAIGLLFGAGYLLHGLART